MTDKAIHQFISYFLAAVWLINGLVCKVLNLVPRHQQIVGEILGTNCSRVLTIAIGCSEILMTIWILSTVKTKLNAIAQIAIVATMNLLEFILVPHLLLWGRANAIFALIFILVVYFNEFNLNKKIGQQT